MQSYCASTVQNGILLTGGYTWESGWRSIADCWFFNMQDKRWKEMPGMLEGRHEHRAVVLAEGVYVLGGKKSANQLVCSMEYVDLYTC